MMSRALARSSDPITASEPGARPLYAIIGGVWAILLLVGPQLGVTIDSELAVLGLPAIFALAVAWLLKRRGWAGAATAVECLTLLATAAFSFVLLSFVLARFDFPYIDPILGGVERSLGFDWRAMAIGFSGVDWLSRAAHVVYQSLWWQMTALVVLHCATGQRARCWSFALAWALALTATLAIFAVAPAIGAYSFYHIDPSMVSRTLGSVGWRQAATLEHLRHASSVMIDARSFAGIVEFPSFHTASATLLIWGFWPIRQARHAALALNIGVIFASVPIGGHYLTDIVAGVAIAMVGIKSSALWRKFEFVGVKGLTSRRGAIAIPAA